MNKQEKIDEILSARPFKNNKFNHGHKEAVIKEVSRARKNPSIIRGLRMLIPALVVLIIGVGGAIWLPALGQDPNSQGNDSEVQQPPMKEEQQLTLAENAEGFRLFVIPSEANKGRYFKIYLENEPGKVHVFNWEMRYYDPDFPPAMGFVNMDQDASEELLIVITQEHEAGSFIQEAHLLNVEDLSEIEIQDPVDYVNEQISSTITKTDDQVIVDLKVNEESYRYVYKESEAGVWNETLSFGYILRYGIQNDRLQAEIPAVASLGGLTVGSVKVDYKFAAGSLSVEEMKFTDTNSMEFEAALKQYAEAITNRDTARLVELYGGSYDWLSIFAPESERSNKEKVFENYLAATVPEPIYFGDILEKTEVSKDEFIFVITFKKEDGALFDVGNGETRNSRFTYTLKREDGKIKVMETPPYQP